MKETWRWFGPDDPASLSDIRQAGATGIVTALYHIPPGVIWSKSEIDRRQNEVANHPDGRPSGLTWDVVESLAVSEAIKTGGAGRDADIAAWIGSMTNIAAAGLQVICYNFMPVLDWTRTDLRAPMVDGALALRFDLVDFAAFDLHILNRADAAQDYTPAIRAEANLRAGHFTDEDRKRLKDTILAGLPGAMEHWTLKTFRDRLADYNGITALDLRENLAHFLRAVVPTAERLGLKLCCHPDDPPWPLFGLPRIISIEADLRWLVEAVPSPANGITLCTGSLGARADNDLPGMIKRLGHHIHFLHLRNVRRAGNDTPGSFHEDGHLTGSTDMVAVIDAILTEETRRRSAGQSDSEIPMRPDHGQAILDDQTRQSPPGYPAIGRLKGLAELRGVALALAQRS